MLNKREYPPIGETVFYDRLENGLRLCVVPRRGFTTSLAMLTVDFGSTESAVKYKGKTIPLPSGTAHFLEHRVFEMAGGVSAMSVLTDMGANVNAFTASDLTAYHFDCSSGFMDALEVFLSFIFHPEITEEGVRKEKPIILREIAMSRDEPETELYYGLLRCLFKRHPIREPILGTEETVATIDSELLNICHSVFYVPANMALTVVGDLDPIQVRDHVERVIASDYYNPPERIPGPRDMGKPVSVHRKKAMEISGDMFLAGAKTDSPQNGKALQREEIVSALALCYLMGEASPLYNRMYEEGIVNETFSFESEITGGVSFISLGGESQDPEKVLDAVFAEAEAVVKAGLDEKRFSRLRKAAIGDELRDLNSFECIADGASWAMLRGYDFFDTVSVIKSVEAEEIREYIAKSFVRDRFAVSEILAKGGQEQ